ncbi:hypothetical protein SAMN04488239_1404 [Ruegeria marina]|uniref:Aminotransferase class-V n=1 Tax=Ruegeria marina TaxID=639004 RepID=A0A1G7FRE3_9RHOB|nr:hypothetical protein SAMN04488239_1404 [Ruegeria marina]
MAIALRDLVDDGWLVDRQENLRQRALNCWSTVPGLDVLGHEPEKRALPIFSLVFRDGEGEALDAAEAALLLSERYGLQVRGGCSCAGPYRHRFLGIDRAMSERLVALLDAGLAIARPGWVRFNLSPYLDEAKAAGSSPRLPNLPVILPDRTGDTWPVRRVRTPRRSRAASHRATKGIDPNPKSK